MSPKRPVPPEFWGFGCAIRVTDTAVESTNAGNPARPSDFSYEFRPTAKDNVPPTPGEWSSVSSKDSPKEKMGGSPAMLVALPTHFGLFH